MGMKDYRAHPKLTPLHIAAVLHPEHVDLVRTLLDRKANPNVKDRIKRLPIELAANVGKRQVVELLIAHGAKKDQGFDKKLKRYEQMHDELLGQCKERMSASQ